MSDTLDGFNDIFKFAVWGLLQHCNGSISSGSRTAEEQQALIDEKGLYSSTNPGAAPVGTSHHQAGVLPDGWGAVDLDGDLDCMHANAAQYGLEFPISNEKWHLEASDELMARGWDFFGGQPGEAAQPEAKTDPMSVAERLLFGDPGDDEGDITSAPTGGVATGADGQPVKAALSTALKAPFDPEASAGFTPGAGSLAATEVATYLAQAGFQGEALVTAVAVSMGESGWDAGAIGDTSLTDATWGPSMGLMQVRSLNAEKGKGTWRDGSRLLDPAFNAKAAFAISNGGTNFGPWTVFSKGIYHQYEDQARAAVAAIGGGAGMATPLPSAPETPMEASQWDDLLGASVTPSDMAGAATGDIVEGISPADEIPVGMRKREEFASA